MMTGFVESRVTEASQQRQSGSGVSLQELPVGQPEVLQLRKT
jgi:hypothetical protein